MQEEKNSINGYPVPRWMVTGSYVLGWIFGILMLLEALFGVVESRVFLFMTGLYLIFFPLFREGPGVVLRRIFGGGR